MAKRTYMLALAVALVSAVPHLGIASPDDTNATSVIIHELVKSNQDTFNALLQLQLSPIEIFDNTSLQTEFTALTKKLQERD